MTPLTGTEVTAIISAVISPISDNLVGILSITAGVSGILLVIRYFRHALRG